MIWVILSLLSGLGDATLYALMKKAREMGGMFVVWVQYAFSLPYLLFALLFYFPKEINPQVYPIAIINGVGAMFVMALLHRAFKAANLSLTIPLLSFTSVFLLITSPLMLGESPNTAHGLFGVLLIGVGTYILNIHELKKSIFGPIKAVWTNVGPRCALGAAFLMSIMSNLFKMGVVRSNPFFYHMLVHVVILVILLPLVVWHFRKHMKQIKENLAVSVGMGASNAFMNVTSGFAVLTAIVPYMISLKRSSIFFGMIYSHFWFKESDLRGRLFGATLMVIGAVLIILS